MSTIFGMNYRMSYPNEDFQEESVAFNRFLMLKVGGGPTGTCGDYPLRVKWGVPSNRKLYENFLKEEDVLYLFVKIHKLQMIQFLVNMRLFE